MATYAMEARPGAALYSSPGGKLSSGGAAGSDARPASSELTASEADSGSNHDCASSTADELNVDGKESARSLPPHCDTAASHHHRGGTATSGARSAASSSGKGSSTGTSPTQHGAPGSPMQLQHQARNGTPTKRGQHQMSGRSKTHPNAGGASPLSTPCSSVVLPNYDCPADGDMNANGRVPPLCTSGAEPAGAALAAGVNGPSVLAMPYPAVFTTPPPNIAAVPPPLVAAGQQRMAGVALPSTSGNYVPPLAHAAGQFYTYTYTAPPPLPSGYIPTGAAHPLSAKSSGSLTSGGASTVTQQQQQQQQGVPLCAAVGNRGGAGDPPNEVTTNGRQSNSPMAPGQNTSGGGGSGSSAGGGGGMNPSSGGGAGGLPFSSGGGSAAGHNPPGSFYVHIQAGESLSVRVGNEIQHIPGPASVRMVSHATSTPTPLQFQVPPGHMVQQLVDEQGQMRHLILSQQPPVQANGGYCNGTAPPSSGTPTGSSNGAMVPVASGAAAPITPPPPQPPPLQQQHNAAAMAPYCHATAAAGLEGAHAGQAGVNAQPAAFEGYTHVDGGYTANGVPRARLPAAGPHFRASGAPAAAATAAAVRPPLGAVAPSGRGGRGAARGGGRAAPRTPPHPQDGYVRARAHAGGGDNMSAASAPTEDDDLEKLMEMLGRVQPVNVLDIRSRDLRLSWQPLDTSEAAASGGPFPQIDASEFTYEILLCEWTLEQAKCCVKCGNEAGGQMANELRIGDLKPATRYFVRLQASLCERGLVGEPSAPVKVYTRSAAPERPLAPFLLGGKRAKNFAMVKWKKPVDNGAPIMKYTLEQAEETGQPTSPAYREVYCGPNDQYKVQRLEASTSYRLRVAAWNAEGRSPFSDPLLVLTVGAKPMPPDPPQLEIAQVSRQPTALTLSWSRRPGDERFILQMEDPASGHGFMPTTAPTQELQMTVTGLRRFEVYHFRLIACNDEGESIPSGSVSFRTEPDAPCAPGTPSVRERDIRAHSAKLNWDAPQDTGGMAVQKYTLELCATGEFASDPAAVNEPDIATWRTVYVGADRQCSVTDLLPGQSYLSRVCCETESGTSPWSGTVHFTTGAVVPAACGNVEVQGKVKMNEFSLKWGMPSTTGGADITDYELVVHDVTDSDDTEHSPAVATYKGPNREYHCCDLLAGHRYSCRVRAHNCAGFGSWSSPLHVSTAAAPPDCPAELRVAPPSPDSAHSSVHCVTLNWKPPGKTNGAAVSQYRIYQAMIPSACVSSRSSLASGDLQSEQQLQLQSDADTTCAADENVQLGDIEFSEIAVIAGSATSYVVKGLAPATRYAFKISAASAAGSSDAYPPRGVFCRTAPGRPAAPSKLSVKAESICRLMVEWTPAVDNGSKVTAYAIEYSVVPPSSTSQHQTSHSSTGSPSHSNSASANSSPSKTPATASAVMLVQPDQCAVAIDELTPETAYRVRVRAENAVGESTWSSTVRACTLSLPPAAPSLELAGPAAHNSLKLRWHDAKSNSSTAATMETFAYALEMENKAGGFSPVYEGSLKSHKVPRLAEATQYMFRIRAIGSCAGAGPWSEPVPFTTTRAPPPNLKAAPRVIEAGGSGSWQIEWSPLKALPANMPSTDKVVYSLQLAPATSSPKHGAGEQWHEEYCGPAQSYTVARIPAGQPWRARVLVVRICGGEKTYSVAQQAPVVVFNNAPLVQRTRHSPESEDIASSSVNSNDSPANSNSTGWSEQHIAVAILVVFSLVAVVIALLVQYFFLDAPLEGTAAATSAVGSEPSAAPPAVKMVTPAPPNH